MKKNCFGGALVALLALLMSAMPFIELKAADQVTTVHLKTAADWEAFAQRVNKNAECDLNAVMDNDIDLGTIQAMVGNYPNYYSGTFDGNGHVLTVHYNNTDKEDNAPFEKVDGATIKNLTVKGEIIADNEDYAVLIAGIAALPKSGGQKTVISNCAVYAKLQSIKESSCCARIGGFMAWAQAPISIDNCLFAGEISSSAKYSSINKIFSYNFSDYSNTISNSLCLGKISSKSSTLSGLTATNVYEYEEDEANRLPSDIATQVTAKQLASGEIAYNLNGSSTNTIWGQAIDCDATPVLNGEEVVKDESEVKVETVNNFPEGKTWKTLIYPKDCTTASGLRIFTVTGVSSNNVLELSEFESGKVPANTPVILYRKPGVSDSEATYTFKPFSYRNEASTTGIIRGTYARIKAEKDWFVMQSQGQPIPSFYRVVDAFPTFNPFTCYLVLENVAGNKITLPSMEPTAIQNIQTDSNSFGDGKIYTLDGKQTTQMEKGQVYIMNGKKFIIK